MLPVKFNEPPASTVTSKVPVPVAPTFSSGTLKFSVPANAKSPPEFKNNAVRSTNAPAAIPSVPPERSVKLFMSTLAFIEPEEESPTFCSVPAAVSVSIAPSNSEVNSGRNP